FLTTFRSCASGGSAVDLSFLSCADTTRPVITAVAPTTALRIRNVRRSTPAGISCERRLLVSFSKSSFSLLDMADLTVYWNLLSSIDSVEELNTVRITRKEASLRAEL